MNVIGSILLYLTIIGVGFLIQYLLKCSPRLLHVISYLIVISFPPLGSLGMMAGLWIACAFYTYLPQKEQMMGQPPVSWRRILFSSLWTFSGFLLTLILLWKLKTTTGLEIASREVFAWVFLIFMEVCFFRIIVRTSPGLYRIPLGYGIAGVNYLFILYSLIPLGWFPMVLTLISLLILVPLLLLWVDLPVSPSEDTIFRRR